MKMIRAIIRPGVVKVILKNAKTGEKGAFGDGKIFISQIEEVYTISSGINQL